MQTKLKSRKWRSLVSSILLAASASSILIAPVFAAEYTEPLTGVVKDDKAIIKADGNKVSLNKTTNTITYDFQGQDHTFTIKNSDGIATNTDGGDYKYVFNNVGADGSKGTIHIYQSNTKWNPFEGVNGFVANGSTTTVNSNLDITATADYASVGVTASGNGTLIINGYDLDSVNWSQIIEGDYETFVMKGVRSAATTSLHTWRDNMQDTYTGADLADEDGMFAKALGGKTSSDVKGLKDSNTYYGVQVGYDKAAANGWHTGVAFDYRNGDSNYLLGGKGDNQMYSLGVYGVKSFENDAFFRVAAKVGRVQNEYDVYNEIRSLKLHGDYKANAYGLTMEYGKTFGTEESYFTPKAQLTWSQVGAKDYTAHTDKATMQINQDSYSSFVGRLGFEAGVKSEKGRLYAGLFAAHEFNGDISASYFANDGDRKHTSFNGEETWMEMKLGGSYDFSKTAHLYADIAKDFGGNFERKWKLNAGLRFEF